MTTGEWITVGAVLVSGLGVVATLCGFFTSRFDRVYATVERVEAKVDDALTQIAAQKATCAATHTDREPSHLRQRGNVREAT